MLVCSRCGEMKERLLITGEDTYCPDCYELEECDMLYGRGGDYEAFCDIKYVLQDINGRYCVIEEDGRINGYICGRCEEHVHGKSSLTGYCVSCAGELMEEMFVEEEEREYLYEPSLVVEEGTFTF